MTECLGLSGRKEGMTRFFKGDGFAVPVTVLNVAGNVVVQVKTLEVDGYCAVQVAFGDRPNVSRFSKSVAGHYAKAGVVPKRLLREFRVSPDRVKDFAVGQEILVSDVFKVGQKVDVAGISIGKGFAGVIKRHGFSSNRASHGNSISHRTPGSIGMAQDPGRVFPGKRMAGRCGGSRVTVQNLEIARIDDDRGLIWVQGAVPGAKGLDVAIYVSVKRAA